MVKNSWRDPTHCKFAHDRFKPISFPAEPREFRSFFHPSRCLNNRNELFHRTEKAVTTPTTAVSIDYEIYRTISGKLRARLPIESRFRWKEREREFLSFYSANPSVASNRGAGRLITLDNRGGARCSEARNCEVPYTVIAVAAQTRRPGVIYGSARCVTSCSPYDLIGFNYSPLKVTAAA